MNEQAAPPPVEFSSAALIDNYDLTFDPGDKRNGSLYLCTPRGSGATPAEWVRLLRGAGLWSEDPAKTVADDQRQAY